MMSSKGLKLFLYFSLKCFIFATIQYLTIMHQKYPQNSFMVLMVCYFVSLLILSCKDSHKTAKIDVSKIAIPFQGIRFDSALFRCDTNQLDMSVEQLYQTFPDFTPTYFGSITGFSNTDDKAVFMKAVHHFLTYKDYKGLMDTVRSQFPTTKSIDNDLIDLFKHIRYYYPQRKLGKVYYFVSGLNYWSAVTVDTCVGVGLDMYLGLDYPFYQSVQIPQYQINRCDKKYIAVNVSKAIYEDMHPFNAEGKSLLDLFIQRGKEMLFAEYTLPDTKPELYFGFSEKQFEWCEKNEALIWNYFTKTKLLYSTQWQEILRYVNDGPNSTGMPPESPGNIGSWVGWKIAHQYLDKHPEMTWKEFVEKDLNSQTIIQDADYRPRE